MARVKSAAEYKANIFTAAALKGRKVIRRSKSQVLLNNALTYIHDECLKGGYLLYETSYFYVIVLEKYLTRIV